jgi:transposase
MMKFVVTKAAEQLDLQALHRVRERLLSQRTGIINQIRAFLRSIRPRRPTGASPRLLRYWFAKDADAARPVPDFDCGIC